MSNQSNNNAPDTPTSPSALFGVPITSLCWSADGAIKIPHKIEQLITRIEIHGIYTEGLYRKSGVNSKIRELKAQMNEPDEIVLDQINMHVLANVLKLFLREMPEPLLTFDRYDDFLRASELSETTERVSTLMSLIKKLPPAHHAMLERLIFHLALVAQREQFNRMSASSLAIVFAPCVLRTNRIVPAQDSLNDIGRQTKCLETLIEQKMINVKSTLADINNLDSAAHDASTRLSTLRSSKVFTQEEVSPHKKNLEEEAEEMLLEDQLQEFKKEKAILTSTLPSLARASSDDDLLSTDLDGEGGSLDDLSSGRLGDNVKESVDSSMGSLSEPNASPDTDNNSSASRQDSSGMNDCLDAPVVYNLRDQNIDYLPASRPIFTFSRSSSNCGSPSTSSAAREHIQQHRSPDCSSSGHPIDSNADSQTLSSPLSSHHLPKPSASSSPTVPTPSTFGHYKATLIKSLPEEEMKSRSTNKKSKRQPNVDDEPIMV